MVFPYKAKEPLKLFLDFTPEIKALWENQMTNDALIP